MLDSGCLRNALIAAVPVPFDAQGRIDAPAQERYSRWMAQQPVEGVAVWAHTGRGLRLDETQRALVLRCWRQCMPAPRRVIAAAGSPPGLADPDQVILRARSMARQALALGADAVLVHPPTAFRDRPDRDFLVLEYHAAIAEAGLPLILFYLYEEAGGVRYSADTLRCLLARPEVLGIKVATLDSVITFQDLASLIQAVAPSKVLITGEDRFLGYSLMCGARAALIGMGAACTSIQAALLHSHTNGQSEQFLKLNRLVDDLAVHTFKAPMEGYIQRMLWCLVHQGVLSTDSAHDPWGPALDPTEFTRLGHCLRRILDEGAGLTEALP
jgi:4-hydroxy-tetrahydrodipicolinate synthase